MNLKEFGYKRPAIVGHRGDSGNAPENTLVSFRQAVDLGVDAVELDVHRTQDGHIVVMHDARVDRTTNGSGALAEMTLEQVRALDAGSWRGAEFAGERVPTLAEVCDLVRGRTFLLVEVKAEGITDDVLAVLKEKGMDGHTVLISFSHDTVRRARALRPDMAIGLLSSHAEDLPKVAEFGADMFCVHFSGATEAMARELHAADRGLNVWTVNEVEDLRRMAAIGADIITSDFPKRAMSTLR